MDYSREVRRRFGDQAGREPLSRLGAVVAGEAQDRTLGVWVKFQLEVVDAQIISASYEVFGCPHAIAATDWVSQWLTRRSLDTVCQLDMHVVARELEVPVQKLGKLLRIEDALLACMDRLARHVVERKQ